MILVGRPIDAPHLADVCDNPVRSIPTMAATGAMAVTVDDDQPAAGVVMVMAAARTDMYCSIMSITSITSITVLHRLIVAPHRVASNEHPAVAVPDVTTTRMVTVTVDNDQPIAVIVMVMAVATADVYDGRRARDVANDDPMPAVPSMPTTGTVSMARNDHDPRSVVVVIVTMSRTHVRGVDVMRAMRLMIVVVHRDMTAVTPGAQHGTEQPDKHELHPIQHRSASVV